MRRVSENQTTRLLVSHALNNKQRIGEISNQLTTGVKASKPSDSADAGAISRYRQQVAKSDSYMTTIAQTKSFLEFQDGVMGEANEILIRARELAQQSANETLSGTSREQIAQEVYQLRDQMASLANSTYQGRYVYSGTDDDDAPFDKTTYDEPATGEPNVRYVFDGEAGKKVGKSVQITDEIKVNLNTPADDLFGGSIEALERLSRALGGYKTLPASGTPDGTGGAYTLPDQLHDQTDAIKDSIDLLNTAREKTLIPERVVIGGRLRRLETAQALLELTKNSAKEVLSRIQEVDETEAAANLQQAQTALQASYSITAKILRMTILDYV
jgi:flagellar hook-associated protein 3 FlgL